jgi:hypothetical protein
MAEGVAVREGEYLVKHVVKKLNAAFLTPAA